MSLPKAIKLVEVGPRDGLQNEKNYLDSRDKISFINQLSKTGLKNIEVTSFVSKQAIPQLRDASTVFKGINKENTINYHALVPNLKGLEKALACGVKHIALFSASSNQFTQKNIGCTVSDSLKRCEEIFKTLEGNPKITVRAYLSCVIACPYEGEQSVNEVSALAKTLTDMGASEISLGDTIGVATPNKTKALIETITKKIDIEKIGMHFHNTFGQALANVYQSLLCGVSTFDSSVAGLGGCPYAPGASGNVASEDVLYLCQGLGIETGVDLLELAKIGQALSDKLGQTNKSNAASALLSQSSHHLSVE